MFENDYKNAMDKITPDADTRDKILDKIILKEEVKNHKNPALPWRIAFAVAACAAIVLSAVFVPRGNLKTAFGNNDGPKTLTVTKSYDEIYKLIKSGNRDNFANGRDDGTVEEYENADITDITAGTSSKPTVQNGADNATGASGNGGTKGSSSEDTDYSKTNEQVEGVNEADIVKTDGKNIYYLSDTKLSIFSAQGENSALISQTQLDGTAFDLYGEMFLKGDRLVLLKTNYCNDAQSVLMLVYDISDPAAPKKIVESRQDGYYKTSRMVGDYIYVVSDNHIITDKMDKDDPSTFVPSIETDGVCKTVPADSIYKYEKESYTNRYTVIGAFNYIDGALSDTASLLGGTENLYCSKGNIILADSLYRTDYDETQESYSFENTTVSRLEISDGQIEYKASGEIEGTLENQFYIDEYNDYFRFVTTVTTETKSVKQFDNIQSEIISYSTEMSARLTVLDKDMKPAGEIKDLAKGERVYSVRFMGDIAYFVTFRNTDPLFSADLSDPQNPKILGELKIPGFSEYMYPYTDGMLLGFGMDADESTGRTSDLKLSMFNITDPANVTEDDKTIIKGYSYSPALSNHKSMLVSSEKNLIGFAATDDYNNVRYLIYNYTGEGFERRAVLSVKNAYDCYAMTDIRGFFINDCFYVISSNSLQSFDINTFLQVNQVEF